MADPYKLDLDEGKWNLFEPNELDGFLRRPNWDNQASFQMWWTSRDAGNAAPNDSDKTDGGLSMRLFENSNSEIFESKATQDFYIYIENADKDETDSTYLRVDE